MDEYHKIQTCFKRDEKTKKIIEGDWTLPEFELLKNCKWVFTEKVDGTNIRVEWNMGKVTFGGKTDNAQIPVKLLYRLQELFEGIENGNKFYNAFIPPDGSVPVPVCLYGEGYGDKIQNGGTYIPDGVDFILFDVKIGDWWLLREDVEEIAQKLGIRVVPIVGHGTLLEAIALTQSGMQSLWGNFTAEGIVARPAVELLTRRGDRIITKIKHRDFNAK